MNGQLCGGQLYGRSADSSPGIRWLIHGVLWGGRPPAGALHIGPSSFFERWGGPALSAGVAALGCLLWAFKKPARLGRKDGSRVCGRWWLWGEVEADPSALAVQWQRRVGGEVQPGASAGRRGRCRPAGAAGLEAGGQNLVLLAAHLEPEGAQIALDDPGRGRRKAAWAAARGRSGGPRLGPRSTSPAADPLAAPCLLQRCV
jgi:hypothetical protein